LTKKSIILITVFLTGLLLICSFILFTSDFFARLFGTGSNNYGENTSTISADVATEEINTTIASPSAIPSTAGAPDSQGGGLSLLLPENAAPACMSGLKIMLDEAYGDSETDQNNSEIADDYTGPEDGYVLVTYKVTGDTISDPKYTKKIPSIYAKYQKDTKNHERIWKVITDVIPLDKREDLDEFIVFTDGIDNFTGAVDEGSTPDTWSFQADVLDFENFSTLSTTVVHEFGHMVTLSSSQIEYGASSCKNYETSDGCSTRDSYINAFYKAFWADIYKEWASDVKLTKDGEVDEDGVYAFYEKYPDQFVSDYAPTDPSEDIAESWTYFIYSSKPKDDSIANQKILFFYQYPELVKLRQQILNGLCPYTEE
jgi:hypothetical protein